MASASRLSGGRLENEGRAAFPTALWRELSLMHALVTLRLGPRTRAWCGICQRIWPPGLHWTARARLRPDLRRQDARVCPGRALWPSRLPAHRRQPRHVGCFTLAHRRPHGWLLKTLGVAGLAPTSPRRCGDPGPMRRRRRPDHAPEPHQGGPDLGPIRPEGRAHGPGRGQTWRSAPATTRSAANADRAAAECDRTRRHPSIDLQRSLQCGLRLSPLL